MKSVLMRMIVMKIRYFHGYAGTWPEPLRHQNLYISYGDTFMKPAKLCTMSEFKRSKVLRIKKPGFGPCLSYKILRIFLLKQQYYALDPRAQNTNFYRGNPLDSPPKKTEHYQLLSLFSLFLLLVHMHFPNSAII